MKRSPLLRGNKPLRRSGRINRESRKRRVQQVRRRALADTFSETFTPCGLSTPVCTGWAEHWHERIGSGVGGSREDMRNLVPACDTCNGEIEAMDRVYVERNGWKVPSWLGVPGEGGLVPGPDASPLFKGGKP